MFTAGDLRGRLIAGFPAAAGEVVEMVVVLTLLLPLRVTLVARHGGGKDEED